MPILVTNGLFELKRFKNPGINALYRVITLELMGGAVDSMNHRAGIFAGCTRCMP